MKLFSLLLFIASTSACASAPAGDSKFTNYVRGLPSDVISLLERTNECHYWGGEEPYDADRAKQIAEAVEKINCDSIDADTKALTEKYKNKPKITDKIKSFSPLP
jgi:hypothetical protein